jgi:heptaprenyl diphosphate synthase
VGKLTGETGRSPTEPLSSPSGSPSGASAPVIPFSDEELRQLRERLRLDPLEDDLVRVQRRLMKELTGRGRFLDEVTSHLARAGGKRLRPLLVLCGTYAAQHDPVLRPAPEEAIVAAVAIEALHLCTLYHDDVMDEATLRRGVPSANVRWDNTVAIIGGDILLARAFQLGASIGSGHAAQLAHALEQLCAGQASELSSLYDPNRDEAAYECAIAGKTASLMAASLHLGGLASAIEPADLVRLSAAGHELGIAFQLVDDLLDILGTASSTGKPSSGADIAAGVYTLPVIVELRTNARLRVLLDSRPSAAEAEEARQLVMAGAGPAITARRAIDHVGRALAILDECDLHPAVKRAIGRLGDLIFEPIRSLQPEVLAAR